LEAHGIVKTFGTNRALKGVDLTVGDGEVVGLIGENGAGKSTVLNIISGVLPYDSGSLLLDGKEIAPKTYQEANRLGIFRVFQEAALVDSLTVYENAFFGWEHLFRSRTGGLDRRRLKRATEESLHEAGVDGLDVTLSTGSLTPGQKQSVDIARVTALASCSRSSGRWCCSTSRRPRWTRSTRTTFCAFCSGCGVWPPSSSSRTGYPRSSKPRTASRSSRTASRWGTDRRRAPTRVNCTG
jgi:ABC-type lipoprotein export system ATPase subunit